MLKKKAILLCFAALCFLILSRPVPAGEDAGALIKKINRAYASDGSLDAIQDITIKGTVSIEGPGGPMEMKVAFYAEKPAKLKIVTRLMPHADFIQAFDGEKAWMTRAGEIRDMPEAAAQEIEFMALTFIDGWLNYSEKGLEISAPEESTGGGGPEVLLEVRDRRKRVSQFFYDRETLRLGRMRGHLVSAEGVAVPTVLYFDDYRNFEGLNLACRVRAEENGKLSWEQTISVVETNNGFPEHFFVKPEPAIVEEEEETDQKTEAEAETVDEEEKAGEGDEGKKTKGLKKEKPAGAPETKP